MAVLNVSGMYVVVISSPAWQILVNWKVCNNHHAKSKLMSIVYVSSKKKKATSTRLPATSLHRDCLNCLPYESFLRFSCRINDEEDEYEEQFCDLNLFVNGGRGSTTLRQFGLQE